MNEINSGCYATTGTATLTNPVYSGGGIGAYANPNNITITTASSNYSLSQAVTNQNNMNKQVKVAVFTVERSDKNQVISSKFVKELWVEIKNGASLELSVAKQLDKDFDPTTTVVREIYSVTF